MSRAHWLTLRFPLEMAFASAATLAVVFGYAALRSEPAPVVSAKVAMTPVSAVPVGGADPRDRLSRFVEQTALAHVGPLRPDAEIDAADAQPPAAVEVATRTLAVHERTKAVAAKPERPQRTDGPVLRADISPRVDPAPLITDATLRPPQPIPVRSLEASGAAPAVPRLEARAADKTNGGFRLPIVSDLAAKLPTGREVSDGVSAFGKRIGAIFR